MSTTTYRPNIRKASSDSSVASDVSDQSTVTSPTGSTQSMNSFTRKKAFFYIPDDELEEDNDEDDQCTFTVTKQPKSSSGSTLQSNRPESKGKKQPKSLSTLKKVQKVFDLSLLERLAQEAPAPSKSQKATQVAKSS